jgi:hypothetical protein
MMLGAAVATGYVLGSMGGESEPRWHGQPMVTGDYTQHAVHQAPARAEPSHGDGLLGQFDDEIGMLKTAAIATLTDFLRSTIREYVPAMGQHLDTAARERKSTPSTSPGASVHAGTVSYPEPNSYGSNRVARHSPLASEGDSQPPGERERSMGAATTRP